MFFKNTYTFLLFGLLSFLPANGLKVETNFNPSFTEIEKMGVTKSLNLIYSSQNQRHTLKKEVAIATILLKIFISYLNKGDFDAFNDGFFKGFAATLNNTILKNVSENLDPDKKIKIWSKVPGGIGFNPWNWKTDSISINNFFNDLKSCRNSLRQISFEQNISAEDKFMQRIVTHYLPVVDALERWTDLPTCSIFQSLNLFILDDKLCLNLEEVEIAFLQEFANLEVSQEVRNFFVGLKDFQKSIKNRGGMLFAKDFWPGRNQAVTKYDTEVAEDAEEYESDDQ